MARTPNDKPLSLGENALGRGLALITLALLALGVVLVQSALASVNEPGAWYHRVDVRHTIFAVAAILVLLAACHFDYRRLARPRGGLPVWAVVVFCGAMITGLLVFVPGLGKQMGTYYRWVRFGPPQYNIQFQPSELIKYALVILLAALFTMQPQRCRRAPWVLGALGVIAVAMALVITQDMGTAIIIGAAGLTTMLLAGVPWYYAAALLPPAAVGFWYYITHMAVKMARIGAWMDPWSQENASSHQVRESLLAITSGGWFGKGPGNSVMKLGYLPERTTDYIFAVFCEEWGLMGSLLLFALLAAWAWYVRCTAVKANNRFGSVLAAALGFTILLQALMHIAVNLNVLPPTGICLPFVSYGGTQMLILAVAAALIISVSARREMATEDGMMEAAEESAAESPQAQAAIAESPEPEATVAADPQSPNAAAESPGAEGAVAGSPEGTTATTAVEPPAPPVDLDASAAPVTVDDLDAFLATQNPEPLFADLEEKPTTEAQSKTRDENDRTN
ncbi:MAG: FtsW/RodA/SpoVE family cell cycle protein [Planctomycetaceae bacterium]|nr:FtsW/RodA/SpoVE family cell cycle protein [Planctomycetaceae bacterium]